MSKERKCSPEQFLDEWERGELEGIPYRRVRRAVLWIAYNERCWTLDGYEGPVRLFMRAGRRRYIEIPVTPGGPDWVAQ